MHLNEEEIKVPFASPSNLHGARSAFEMMCRIISVAPQFLVETRSEQFFYVQVYYIETLKCKLLLSTRKSTISLRFVTTSMIGN